MYESVELSSFVCELHLIIECYFSFCLTEEKETINLDGSICVPFDKVKVKLYYPTREENHQTTDLVMKMGVEVAEYMLKELQYPKKGNILLFV